MRFILSRGLRLAAMAALLLSPMVANATVEISIGPQDPFERDIGARARWGASGYEANLRNNGLDVAGTELNPAGGPVWQLGQSYDFRLSWQAATGTTTWQIDFNRDGLFSASETSSFIKPERIGQSFQYIEMTLATQTNGNNSSGLNVNNLSINGTSFGNFAQSGNTAQTVWFADSEGFSDIEILGDLSFLRLSGNGNSPFTTDRPSLEFAFVGPSPLEPVPEPAAWAMLIAGFGLVGAAQRRRTRTLSA
jgi:hypothetical protein